MADISLCLNKRCPKYDVCGRNPKYHTVSKWQSYLNGRGKYRVKWVKENNAFERVEVPCDVFVDYSDEEVIS